MIINGDCIEEMQKLIDQGVQVDAVVTDPPYHLQSIVDRFGKTSLSDDTKTSERARARGDGYARMSAGGFMGQEWDGGDVAFRAETWRLAWELLKPGGHLLAFSASRNYHRMAVAIEDAGFEIRDQMMWLYGSGFPKSHNIGKNVDKTLGNVGKNEWEGWGTALKPALEPITVARKPLGEKTVAANVLKYGTGGINIDESRVPSYGDKLGGGSKDKHNFADKEGWDRPWMHDEEHVKKNKEKQAEKVAKAETLGRFPANLIHDGSEEVTRGFPYTKSGKLTPDMNIKASTGWAGGSSANRVKNTFTGDDGSAARFFYVPKTSKKDRNDGLENFTPNNHPTVKPTDLMRYLVTMVTPKGGTTLDPFMGSGSTGRGAKLGGFNFIGIELDENYLEIANARIDAIEVDIFEDFFD